VGQALIIVGAVALDWGLAWLVWQGLKRVAGDRASPRLSDVMPWVLFQAFIVGGLIITGALASSSVVPLAILAAFFAVPVALFKARGGAAIDLRICLDHTYATAAVWLVALVIGVLL